VGSVLERGLAALELGDVPTAIAALTEVADAGPAPLANRLLGGLRYAEGDLDGTRLRWERAFRELRADGDRRGAARVAADLADLHNTSLGNRAAGAGWVQRAQRLLEPVGRCVEQGYLALTVVACEAPDVVRLLEGAELALELAEAFDDGDLQVRALADSGYALVVQGRLAEGFGRLDEAMAALSAGEVRDPGVAGTSYCALLSACDRAGDLRRAEEWSRIIEETFLAPLQGRLVVLHHHCRLAYGSVLCTVGRWREGEEAILEVLEPAVAGLPGHRGDAAARLAALRLLQGRFEDAGELLAPHRDRPAAAEPLARLHLLLGEHDLAAATARRGIDAVPGDRLRIGALLGLLVEVELARGDDAAARAAAAQLTAHVATTEEPTLLAEATLAHARVARDVDGYRRALAGLGDERPHVRATISLELAELLVAVDPASATIEAGLALATFDRLGASLLVDRANALLRGLGTRSRATGRPASAAVAGLTAREAEVLSLLAEGLTNAEIAARLFISAKTAEHHVGHVLAKLGVRSRAEAAAVAAAARRGRG
jgi:DNA-binding CsgD family transcriptional regulator